jgi:hypothetical protein
MQIPCQIELDGRDNAGDKFQKDEKRKLTLDLLPAFSHRVRHTFQYIRMSAWMHRRHWYILNEREGLDRQSFVQVLLLNILFDSLVADGLSVYVCSTEKHSWGMIVFVVNDVHCV